MANASDRPNTGLTLLKLLGALLATGVLAAGLLLPYVGGIGLTAKNESDKFLSTSCNLTPSPPPVRSTILASDKKTVLAYLYTQDRDPLASISDVPKTLIQALVDTEDRRFYDHHGVDLRGLVRSAFSTGGGNTQGGSTLTMQYVKQVRYYQDIGNPAKQQADIEQTLSRKMEDAQCAIQLEKKESKSQILLDYLNIAYFGENSYSIQSAAETYFGVPAAQLTVPQSAMLVGLLQAPTAYDPFSYRTAATTRRNEVLQNMVTAGDLTQAQANSYGSKPIQLTTNVNTVQHQGCTSVASTNYGFFCNYVVNWLEDVDGLTASQLDTGGYTVVTTLNPSIQASTQQNLVKQFPSNAAMTAVLPVLDPKTGQILAMASNKIYGNPTAANDNTHTMIDNFGASTAFGASTYKLFSLLAALQTGVPTSWEVDTYGGTANAANKNYTPKYCTWNAATDKPVQNQDDLVQNSEFETLSQATAVSSNTFFVAMNDQLFGCDLTPVVQMAQSLGMSWLSTPISNTSKTTEGQNIVANEAVVPLSLGSGIPTSPLELAGAYAAVANGGQFIKPHPVLSITDSNGDPVPDKANTRPVQVISPQAAAYAVQLLAGDTQTLNGVSGTSATVFANQWNNPSAIVAGKTGTAVAGADQNKDSALWFVGMTPKLVATAAVINPSSPSNPIPSLPHVSATTLNSGAVDGSYAASLWLDALTPTLKTFGSWSWVDPVTLAGGSFSGSAYSLPSLAGQTVDAATALLKSAPGGPYKLVPLSEGLQCAGNEPAGSIAFASPTTAPAGSTVTYCLSSGSAQLDHQAPPPQPSTSAPSTHSSSSSSSAHAPAGGTSSSSSTRRNPGGPGGNGGGGGNHPG